MPTTTGISFDGVDDEVAKTWSGKTNSSNKKFTVAGWFEVATSASGEGALFEFVNAATTGNVFFGLSGSDGMLGGVFPGNVPFFFVTGDGGHSIGLYGPTFTYGVKYFFMLVYDSAQATQANRLKGWFGPYNGAVTAISGWTDVLGSGINLALNETLVHGDTGAVNHIGYDETNFWKGKTADVYWLDNVALADPSSLLNNYSSAAAPGTYAGAYGNTGYHLDFSNSGSLGADSSGNANNFTPAGGPTQLTGYFAAAGKTLALATGAFLVNAQAITLRRGKVLSAAAASFSVNAQAVGLLRSRKFPIAAGAFTVNAQAINFLKGKRLFVTAADFLVNAQALNFTRAIRKLAAAAAAFAVNGQALGLLRGRKVTVTAGAFTVNEQPITLRRGRSAAVAAASYAVNAQAVGLLRGRKFPVAAGSWLVNAQALGMLVGRRVLVTAGAFTVNEQPLTLRRGRAISVAAGAFAVNAQALTMLRGKIMTLATRAYTVNEQAISFRRTIRMPVANSAFTVNAQNVGFFIRPPFNGDITALYNKGLGKKRFWLAARARDLRNRGF